jgi:hypothetical protein
MENCEVDSLRRELSRLENIVKLRLPQRPASRRVATALRELYAAKSAIRILRFAGDFWPDEHFGRSGSAEENGRSSGNRAYPTSVLLIVRASPCSKRLPRTTQMRRSNSGLSPLVSASIQLAIFFFWCVHTTWHLNSRFLAEREGFEPPVPFRVRRFSRPEPSTTRPPLRVL